MCKKVLEYTKILLQMVSRIIGKYSLLLGQLIIVNMGLNLQMLWNHFLSTWCSIKMYHLMLHPIMSYNLVGVDILNFRQVLHGTAGGMSPQVQARNQPLPGSTPV
jgi:hypothetical protein